MASIVAKERKKGTAYYIAYRIVEEGKPKQIWYPCETRKEANRLIGEVEEAEKENRRYVKYEPRTYSGKKIVPGNMTVKEMVDKYIDHASKVKGWTPAGRRNVVSISENYIIPYMGNLPIACISTRYLQEFYDDLPNHKASKGNHKSSENISVRTLHEIHKVLRPVFHLAKAWNEISENPAIDVELPKIKVQERDRWSEEEFHKALHLCKDEELKLIMALSVCATLRSGELTGLTWDFVDCSEEAIAAGKPYIYVNQTLTRLSKVDIKATSAEIYFTFPTIKAETTTVMALKPPKTPGSVRKLFIPVTVAKALAEHKRRQDEIIRFLGGEYHDFNLVFALTNGFPYANNPLRKRFKQLITENQLREVDIYSLRHTGADILNERARKQRSVSIALGHIPMNTSKSDGHYVSVSDSDRQDIVDAMTASFEEYLTEL